MKGKTRKRPAKPSLDLIEKKTRAGKIITFPGIQGRTVETLRLYTSPDENSIAIHFQDQTLFSISLEPGLIFEADLGDNKTGDLRPIKAWPPIVSAPRNPG